MPTIVDYHLVKANDIDELDDRINSLIRQGFQPYGDPVIPVHGDGTRGILYCQAIVKYANQKERSPNEQG